MKKTGNAQFEDTMKTLESLITSIESNEISMEDSLKAFEEGVKLIRSSQKYLAGAEQRVKMLTGENDTPDSEDFEESNI